ncbi:MAG: hypothetical protein AABX89_04515 [Candidatus Thermoplasmatota archaeon]
MNLRLALGLLLLLPVAAAQLPGEAVVALDALQGPTAPLRPDLELFAVAVRGTVSCSAALARSEETPPSTVNLNLRVEAPAVVLFQAPTVTPVELAPCLTPGTQRLPFDLPLTVSITDAANGRVPEEILVEVRLDASALDPLGSTSASGTFNLEAATRMQLEARGVIKAQQTRSAAIPFPLEVRNSGNTPVTVQVEVRLEGAGSVPALEAVEMIRGGVQEMTVLFQPPTGEAFETWENTNLFATVTAVAPDGTAATPVSIHLLAGRDPEGSESQSSPTPAAPLFALVALGAAWLRRQRA